MSKRRSCPACGKYRSDGDHCPGCRRGYKYEVRVKAVTKALRKIPHEREDTVEATTWTWAKGRIVLFKPPLDPPDPVLIVEV